MNLEQIIKRKEELKITFEELAQKTDISISTLKDIFRGKTKCPRIDTLERIWHALNMSNENIPPVMKNEKNKIVTFARDGGRSEREYSDEEMQAINKMLDALDALKK